jgi:hypothetical protein
MIAGEEDTAAMRNGIMPLRSVLAISLLGLACGAVHAATLKVGPSDKYKTIAAAVAASHDGDVVDIQPGTYINDFAEIGTKITLQAVGGFAKLKATVPIPNEKAILITDTDITIRNIQFIGARVSQADGGNGAGIRYQAGNLTLNECYFTGNQDGILGVGDGTGTVTIEKSEFYRNGAKTGPSAGYTHNLYLGGLAKLTITDSYFHGANVGHEIKSRAAVTVITNTRVVDGPTGTASYSIDVPNGGAVMIADSQIEQGPQSENPNIVAFGEEGSLHPGSKLVIQGSLIANDLNSSSARGVWNAAGKPVTIRNTQVFGLTPQTLVNGQSTHSGITYLKIEPVIPVKHPWVE